jgi:hypothetical protein
MTRRSVVLSSREDPADGRTDAHDHQLYPRSSITRDHRNYQSKGNHRAEGNRAELKEIAEEKGIDHALT